VFDALAVDAQMFTEDTESQTEPRHTPPRPTQHTKYWRNKALQHASATAIRLLTLLLAPVSAADSKYQTQCKKIK